MKPEESNGRSAQAMRALVLLVREDPTPPVDWDRAEGELIRRVTPEAERRRVGQPRWQRNGFVAAAVFAAAAALLALMVRTPSSAPLGSPPQAGTVYTAHSAPRTFAVGAVANCTLAPNSRVVLRCDGSKGDPGCPPQAALPARDARGGLRDAPGAAAGTPYVLVLERGSVAADVVPLAADAPLVESLVVEAGGLRVAVHGTSFSVRRTDREVTVEVTRGAVTVGPAGHRGVTTGHLLVAPARAAFSIDGARVARLLPLLRPDRAAAPAQPSAPRVAPIATLPLDERDPLATPADPQPVDRSGAPADEPPLAVAERPGTGDLEPPPATAEGPESAPPSDVPRPLELGEARSRMVACLGMPSQPSPDGGEVRVTISSQVRLQLDGERRIISVRFSPPLKPELQQRCAGAVLGQRLSSAAGATEFAVVFSPR